jgi:hypothetical protein
MSKMLLPQFCFAIFGHAVALDRGTDIKLKLTWHQHYSLLIK